jgi:uncharacterized membrane protein
MDETQRETPRAIMRWALALFYGAAGLTHLAIPEKFLLITPDWVPHAREIILFTGICELAGAAGLLYPPLRRSAGVMLALYAICVFPANVKHALEGVVVPGLPTSWLYHGPRLAFQPVLVWMALYTGGVVDWPFRRKRA